MKARTKSKKVNKAWLHEHLTDPYVKLAVKEGYRARAAYKLAQIDEAMRLLRPGQLVVDLGAAPGAWSQYVRRKFDAQIIALDMIEFEPLEGVQFIRGDFRDGAVAAQLESLLAQRKVDVVLSDLSPNLSGIESSDASRVADLVELAVDFASRHLAPSGAMVCKVFHGSGYSQLVELFKRTFRVVKPIKPKASRDKSAETFLVGVGLKAAPPAGATRG